MEVPAERIERLQRWFRRAVAAGLVVVSLSLVQTAGWFAAVAGLTTIPLIDEAPLAAELTRRPAAVRFGGNTTVTHTVWAVDDELVRHPLLDAPAQGAVARGLRAVGFERVYGPDDPVPEGIVAEWGATTRWEHPFVVRTRQTVSWGDPIAGTDITVTSRRVWVMVGWWSLEPDVTKERWFDRENR